MTDANGRIRTCWFLSLCRERHQPATGFLSDPSGLMLIGEPSKMNLPSVGLDLSLPETCLGLFVYPTVGRSRVGPPGNVLHVAGVIDDTQVQPPIVEAVTVDVVPFKSVSEGQPQQLAMHQNSDRLTRTPFSASSVALHADVPSPLIGEIDVSIINERIRPDGTVAPIKGDTNCPIGQAIILVHRVPPVPCAVSPAVTSSAGTSRVNYTRYQEGVAL